MAALAAYALVSGVGTSAAANGGPLHWRDNGTGPWIAQVCSLPLPRVAGCSANVVTNSAGMPQASSSPAPGALGPSQFHSAYSLPTTAPNTETIGIVDAYDDPNIASDLATYDAYYGLPAPPNFTKVNQTGGTSYPVKNSSWALEISLDVEVAHAVCENCNILLVEASSNSFADLGAAENEAVKLGATVISNSWGGSEYSAETSDESLYFNHPGIPITVSAGDSGYGVEFPAASQYVTAVGGTTLTVNSDGSYGGETVWNGTGSGCSQYEPKPSWQHDACTHRALNDVAADADPATGAAVYDSVRYQLQSGWFQVGGTSLASPLIAAVYALGGNPGSVTYGSSPYAAPAQLHDVLSGNNGSCGGSYLCTAGLAYDGPTGWGTPNGVGAFGGVPPVPGPPGAPTGLQATGSNNSVSLLWTPPVDNGGSLIAGYDVYRGTTSGGESSFPIATGVTTPSYTDNTAVNGTTYYYEVSAVNGTAEGAKSNEASAKPQAPPSSDFSLSISPSSRSIGRTARTTYTVTITPKNGFSGQVTLTVSGLPAHVTGSFSINPATSSSKLKIKSSGASAGTATLTVTGTSGSLTHTATASLVIS